jgi:hypothetical protein
MLNFIVLTILIYEVFSSDACSSNFSSVQKLLLVLTFLDNEKNEETLRIVNLPINRFFQTIERIGEICYVIPDKGLGIPVRMCSEIA